MGCYRDYAENSVLLWENIEFNNFAKSFFYVLFTQKSKIGVSFRIDNG